MKITSRKKPLRSIFREALPLLSIVLGSVFLFSILGLWWLSGLALAATFFVLWFFRDPEREIPGGVGEIVSPADGRVVEVSRVQESQFLKADALKVGIFMSPVDVHVNRIPCDGKVLAVEHQEGKFLSAFKPEASLENERNAVLLEMSSGRRLLFVQIAGLLARRIVHWLHEGDQVHRGERYGLIKFGSRMDLYLPLDTEILVKPGQKVQGGASLIGRLK